jgi:hypothetical protein
VAIVANDRQVQIEYLGSRSRFWRSRRVSRPVRSIEITRDGRDWEWALLRRGERSCANRRPE